MTAYSELAWIIEFPVPCGDCGKESLQIVARLVDLTEITCGACGAILDLDTEEWTALRNTLKELYVGKSAPIAPVKKIT